MGLETKGVVSAIGGIVIIAYAEGGKPLRPDDKGPLSIVYPFWADPGLKKDTYFSRCAWQLSGLTMQ